MGGCNVVDLSKFGGGDQYLFYFIFIYYRHKGPLEASDRFCFF